MKLSVDEYCRHFKISKEVLYSKIRAKKLDTVIEDSMVYIVLSGSEVDLVAKEKTTSAIQIVQPQKPKTTVATVLSLYQKENKFLKDKIVQLEAKIDKLIDDKEQLLRDEIEKIERIYSSRDMQLKNILELIDKKMKFEPQEATIHEIESFSIDKEKQDIYAQADGVMELKEYLKSLNIKSSQKKIIKKRFLDAYDNDIRVIHKEGKLYLDFSRYDYSDLLAC